MNWKKESKKAFRNHFKKLEKKQQYEEKEEQKKLLGKLERQRLKEKE